MKLSIIGEDRQRCQERPLLSPAAGNRRRRRQRRRRAADSLQLLWPIWPQKPEWWENRESDRGWKWRWSRPRRLQAGCPPPQPAGRQGPHVPCSCFRPRRFVGRVWPALGEQPSAAFADIFKAMSVAIPRIPSQTAGHFFAAQFCHFLAIGGFDSTSMDYTLPWKVDLWHFQGYPMLVGNPHRRPAYFSVIHLFSIRHIICWKRENLWWKNRDWQLKS